MKTGRPMHRPSTKDVLSQGTLPRVAMLSLAALLDAQYAQLEGGGALVVETCYLDTVMRVKGANAAPEQSPSCGGLSSTRA